MNGSATYRLGKAGPNRPRFTYYDEQREKWRIMPRYVFGGVGVLAGFIGGLVVGMWVMLP